MKGLAEEKGESGGEEKEKDDERPPARESEEESQTGRGEDESQTLFGDSHSMMIDPSPPKVNAGLRVSSLFQGRLAWGVPMGRPQGPWGPSSFAAVIFHAGQLARLGAKTTRSACATLRSNTFWRFPLKLPSSGFCPAKSPLMLSLMIPSALIQWPLMGNAHAPFILQTGACPSAVGSSGRHKSGATFLVTSGGRFPS